MQYKYCPNNPERFATNLRREQGTANLKWDNARGQDVLIVQTPFEKNAISLMEKLCADLGRTTIHPDKYTEVQPGVWVRFVTAADKARMGGCPINTEASTYTVFSCSTEGDICSIYAPQDQAMITAFCNIPMELHIAVMEQTKTEGLFRKRTVPTGYYVLSFPKSFAGGYNDGDLVYKVSNLMIPITKAMFKQGDVFVKTEHKPEIISKNKGLKLTK